MTRLPVVSGHDAVEALCKMGCEIDHQTDSHMILRRATVPHRRLTIPDHKELAKGTLRAIIREAGLTVDEFAALL
ncbi:MAG: type II toxin-antitoxin system HicA family toxin [Planctomycetes bacterium]|nr:type II toxin-antitoxin system HicA family toxin [Planctomycetota bacterium]